MSNLPFRRMQAALELRLLKIKAIRGLSIRRIRKQWSGILRKWLVEVSTLSSPRFHCLSLLCTKHRKRLAQSI